MFSRTTISPASGPHWPTTMSPFEVGCENVAQTPPVMSPTFRIFKESRCGSNHDGFSFMSGEMWEGLSGVELLCRNVQGIDCT